MKTFPLRFLCADEIEYEGPCVSLNVPLSDGSAGYLADHANTRAIIGGGELRIDTGTEELVYAVTEGLLQIRKGEALILAYSAEKPEEIDESRAEQAVIRARMKMKHQRNEAEYRQAQADLSRALNRLKVKHRG